MYNREEAYICVYIKYLQVVDLHRYVKFIYSHILNTEGTNIFEFIMVLMFSNIGEKNIEML